MHGMSRLSRRSVIVAITACLLITAACVAPSLQASIVHTPAVQIQHVDLGQTLRSRASRTLELPIHADMLGASWSGSPRGFELRTRTSDSSWSSWVAVQGDGDGPDPGTREA